MHSLYSPVCPSDCDFLTDSLWAPVTLIQPQEQSVFAASISTIINSGESESESKI